MKFEKLLESIGIEDSGMALNSIQSYLERKLDQKLNRMKWNRVSNKGMNVLFTNTLDAGAIKFNFEIESRDMKYVKKDSMGCTSIDIYSPKKTNGEIGLIEKPTVTMQIPDGVSFAKILPKLVEAIKTPMPNTFTIYKLNLDGDVEVVVEGRGRPIEPIMIDGVKYDSKKDAWEYMRAHGIKIKDALKKLKKASGQNIVEEETIVEVVKGVKDVEDKAVATKQTDALKDLAESLMADIEYKSPIEMFRDIEYRIDDLIKPESNNRSLVVTGMGGVGKTYTITNHLKDIGVDYANGSEVPSTVALFKLLFLNKNENRLLLFDDCDAVVRNTETQNILKLALDTSVSPISYFASKGVFNVEVDKNITTTQMNSKVDKEFLLRNAIVLGYAVPDDGGDEETQTPEDVEYLEPTDEFKENKNNGRRLIEKKKKYSKQELLNMAILNPEFASLWKSKSPINIAKIIDSTGVNISDLIFPSKFYYRGKMIFISNMDEAKWPAPLSSRAFKVNIWLTANEVLDLIKHIMPTLSKQYSMKVKQRALTVFEKNIDRIDAYFKIKYPGNTAYFNLRSFTKSLDIASNESLTGKVLEAQILRFCLA